MDHPIVVGYPSGLGVCQVPTWKASGSGERDWVRVSFSANVQDVHLVKIGTSLENVSMSLVMSVSELHIDLD